MRLRQHAVHSNGTQTITYTGCINTEAAYTECSNTGCTNYSQSGYSNHSNYSQSSYSKSGCGNHSNGYKGGCNWGNWSDGASNDYCGNGGWSQHSNGGYSNHSNYSKSSYSQSGCSDHTNTGYSNHSNSSTTTWTYTNSAAATTTQTSVINSNVPSYVLNSSLNNKGVNLTANTIVLDLSSAYSGAQGYRVYVRGADLGSTAFRDWQLVTEQGQMSSFSVDISTWPQGQVQFAVVAYNGSSWSAILSDNEWTYDHHQTLTDSTNITYTTVQAEGGHTTNTYQTSTKTVISVSDTTQYEVAGGSYALSGILQIIRYTPPTWLTDPYARTTTQQLQNEINKALNNYTGATHVFASSPIVCNWTMITLNNLVEMQAQTNNVLTAAGKTAVDFSSKDYMNGTGKISPDKALKDLQDLLDSLGE